MTLVLVFANLASNSENANLRAIRDATQASREWPAQTSEGHVTLFSYRTKPELVFYILSHLLDQASVKAAGVRPVCLYRVTKSVWKRHKIERFVFGLPYTSHIFESKRRTSGGYRKRDLLMCTYVLKTSMSKTPANL